MIKLLIGGSPCTYWSIAQKANREVQAEGLGWELFRNYLIAKEKFQPDLFLYENNKSAAQAIKDQISQALGVELMHINSSLVSAQNRQRFYAFNWEVEQPEDRGILLKDILETAADSRGTKPEPITLNTTTDGKAQCIRASCYKDGIRNMVGNTVDRRTCVAEAVGVGYRNRRESDGKLYRRFETDGDPKSNALTTVQTDSMVAVPLKVGEIGNGGQGNRIYSTEGKSVAQTASSGGMGSSTGLYAIPFNPTENEKSHTITASYGKIAEQPGSQFRAERDRQRIVQKWNGERKPVYEVQGGQIEIKGKTYPIKLPDGLYIIRKLTPIECERLQTLPDNYTAAVSNTQRYKGLGNGWTAEVIIHILNGALKDVPRNEEIVVLSMYDGIGTGRYCLEKMGFTNVTYYAYEIDKPAMEVALSNYPDIIEMGDAFDLRSDEWELGKKLGQAKSEQKATESKEETDTQPETPEMPGETTVETIDDGERNLLQESEAQEPEKEPTDNTPKTSPPVEAFNAIQQLQQLADERKKLAAIHPDNTRFSNDVLAIEYAVSILEAVC
jgi:DNA (cytosine-5)-methyltransferase 3A